MVVDLSDNGSQVLFLDNFAELDPGGPEKGELVDASDENLVMNKNVRLSLTWFSPAISRPSHKYKG